MTTPHPDEQFFTRSLMDWHATENQRSLPWKSEKDPYRIWLSEVILQQTRALQGLPYYLRFTETYPTIIDMANADDNEVFRIWQGLGYYNRCKNMLATARYIASELQGVFPDTYEGIIQLKGIGPYTASAIASFAYGLPCAVVDGNVYRVLSRYFGIADPIDSTGGKQRFAALAQSRLHTTDSAGYNQAIMDLGATICKPQQPDCSSCPLTLICQARLTDSIASFPIKKERKPLKERPFHFLVFHTTSTIYLTKRSGNDIWKDLHTFYCIEAEKLTQKLLPDFINTR
jgi:A/G-specific adenine glycosylase